MNFATVFDWTLTICRIGTYTTSSVVILNTLLKLVIITAFGKDELLARSIIVMLGLQTVFAIIYTNFIILSRYIPRKFDYKVSNWVKTLYVIGFGFIIIISLQHFTMAIHRIWWMGYEDGRFANVVGSLFHIYGSLYYTYYDLVKYH